jgi:hypothetical protein
VLKAILVLQTDFYCFGPISGTVIHGRADSAIRTCGSAGVRPKRANGASLSTSGRRLTQCLPREVRRSQRTVPSYTFTRIIAADKVMTSAGRPSFPSWILMMMVALTSTRGADYFDLFRFLPANCSKRVRASLLPMPRRTAMRATCCLRGRDVSLSQL